MAKKREDGRYCKNVTLGRNENGSLKRKMVYANTKKELDIKVANLLLQVDKGIIIDDKNKTVDVWADEWLKTYTTHLKDGTKGQHKNTINKYIKPNFKGIRLKDLKQHQVQAVLNSIKHETVPKRFLATMNFILEKAVENDLVSKNVAKGLIAPKFTTGENKPLNNEQINAIKVNAHGLQKLCVFLIYTGLRIGELINLTWNNIDLKKKIIKVQGDVKTPYSNRTVPLFEPAYNILKEMDKSRIKNIDTTKDYIFLNHGIQWTHNAINKQRYNYNKLVGFDFTFHQCRHTFATICYNAGIDAKQNQEWLGHSSVNTTLNIYTHLMKQNKLNAVDKLNEFLKSN